MRVTTSVDAGAALQDGSVISRRLGWIVALAALALALASGLRNYLQYSDFAPWWEVGAAVFGGLFVVLLVAGLWMPLPLLRACWWSLAPLCIALGATSFAAYRGPDLEGLRLWVWSLEPAALAFLVFVAPAWVAVALAVASAAAPVVSSLLVTGAVAPGIAAVTPFHVGSVVLVVILVGLRARLADLHHSEQAALAAAVRQARFEADTEQQRALTRTVHDHVLAVLTAAVQLGGAVPPELQRAAASALDTLDQGAHDADAGSMAADAAAAHLRETADHTAPGSAVDAQASEGEVPRRAVVAVALASAEALRNSIRHSGAEPRVAVRVAADEITVVVADDGAGFDLDGVDARRLGVRESIVGRMESLPGGTARVHSAPGRGTEVTLEWRR
jgi:signal transduction histidine kinase